MSEERTDLTKYRRLEREVYIGGFRLGRRWYGGRWYGVGPLSVFRFNDLMDGLRMATGAVREVFPGDFSSEELLIVAPFTLLKPLASLMVQGGVIRPKDFHRMTEQQFAALWQAIQKTNDMAYIQEALSDSSGDGDREVDELVHVLVKECEGAYSHRQILEFPMQEFLRMLQCAESLAKRRAVDEKGEKMDHTVTDDELEQFKKMYPNVKLN